MLGKLETTKIKHKLNKIVFYVLKIILVFLDLETMDPAQQVPPQTPNAFVVAPMHAPPNAPQKVIPASTPQCNANSTVRKKLNFN